MEYYGQEALNLFVAEGNLRDRALRGAIKSKILHFFDCMDKEDWEGVGRHLRSDARLFYKLCTPGDIHSGIESILSQLMEGTISGQKTVQKLLLVDRGRVTCYVAQFWMQTVEDGEDPFSSESRLVFVIDLDEQQQIRRIEIRDDENEDLVHEGDEFMMGRVVEAAEKDAMRLVDRI
ncbi:hypothetical protein CSHISOI_10565 [Colletotrichum shisoi]|uniref:SnoaL-like domain-containing protein n=1 Tax=Colletotrichum shisoi TaxID=2078593 RepID=A0A5Q4BD98_9PEZI|nr:hypothetical protein CSHISOI_10565 [Colletotrichum shisoi]